MDDTHYIEQAKQYYRIKKQQCENIEGTSDDNIDKGTSDDNANTDLHLDVQQE